MAVQVEITAGLKTASRSKVLTPKLNSGWGTIRPSQGASNLFCDGHQMKAIGAFVAIVQEAGAAVALISLIGSRR